MTERSSVWRSRLRPARSQWLTSRAPISVVQRARRMIVHRRPRTFRHGGRVDGCVPGLVIPRTHPANGPRSNRTVRYELPLGGSYLKQPTLLTAEVALDFVGRYYSDEVEVFYNVAFEDGVLRIQLENQGGRILIDSLTQVDVDAFSDPGGDGEHQVYARSTESRDRNDRQLLARKEPRLRQGCERKNNRGRWASPGAVARPACERPRRAAPLR